MIRGDPPLAPPKPPHSLTAPPPPLPHPPARPYAPDRSNERLPPSRQGKRRTGRRYSGRTQGVLLEHSTATEGAGRFRKLLLSNENVKESIIDTAGALALMRHVGFELQGSGESQSLTMPQPSARRAHAHASARAPRRPLLPVRSAIAFLCGCSGSADGARATGLHRAHARARGGPCGAPRLSCRRARARGRERSADETAMPSVACAFPPSPGADVAGVEPSLIADAAAASPVTLQMWQRRARSRCRKGRGEPSPGADVGERRCHQTRLDLQREQQVRLSMRAVRVVGYSLATRSDCEA